MDLDALVASMRGQQYGDEANEPEPELEVAPAQPAAQHHSECSTGIWNPHVNPPAAQLKAALVDAPRWVGTTPSVEVLRIKAVRALQSRFKKLTAEALGKQWNQSFEKWIFARRQHGAAVDPILPSGPKALRDSGLEADLVATGTSEAEALDVSAELGRASNTAARGVARQAGTSGKLRVKRKLLSDATKDRVELSAAGVAMEINTEHEEKLKMLYERFGGQHKSGLASGMDSKQQPLQVRTVILLHVESLLCTGYFCAVGAVQCTAGWFLSGRWHASGHQ